MNAPLASSTLIFGSTGKIARYFKSGYLENIVDFSFSDWKNPHKFYNSLCYRKLNNESSKFKYLWLAGKNNPRSSRTECDEEIDIFKKFCEYIYNINSNHIDRIVFLSSSGSIFPFNSKKIFNESDEVNPNCSYGFMKVTQESLLREVTTAKKISSLVLRSPSIFGFPYENEIRNGVIDSVILSKNFMNLNINLNTRRQYTHIADLTNIIKMSLKIDLQEKFYLKHIAPNNFYSIEELIYHVLRPDILNSIKYRNNNFMTQTLRISSTELPELDLKNYLDPQKYVKERLISSS